MVGFHTNIDGFLSDLRAERDERPLGEMVYAYKQVVADRVLCPRTVYKLRGREVNRPGALPPTSHPCSDNAGEAQCANGANGSSALSSASPSASPSTSPSKQAACPDVARERTFEIYKCTMQEGGVGFRELHERLQPYILFFVDAASFIDVDDDRWRFFFLYERYKDSLGNALISNLHPFQYFLFLSTFSFIFIYSCLAVIFPLLF